jgi:hypothetical protein
VDEVRAAEELCGCGERQRFHTHKSHLETETVQTISITQLRAPAALASPATRPLIGEGD